MARVTHVKSAQQRYETVPVLDEDGQQKTTPVLRRDGSPKKTKKGREIVRRVTVEDKSKPLPPRKCGKCGKEITPGTSYKWIAPKSGPYGGRKLFRCKECPTWNVWEYSSSTSARIAEIQHNASDIASQASGWESESDATGAAEEIGGLIRELAEDKTASADSIEDGFGHSTYVSDEIREVAEQLESWADEVESVDFPDFPEVEEEVDCEQCGGDGTLANDDTGEDEDCKECEGTGSVANDETEPSEEALEAWREEAEQALQDAIDNCPL